MIIHSVSVLNVKRVWTQWTLIRSVSADIFFNSRYLLPFYTYLTLKTVLFLFFPTNNGSPAESQTQQQRRKQPGRGRLRLRTDKQFLLFFFLFQTSPDVSAHCPLPLQPFPQRTAICSGVLVMKLIFRAILVPLDRQEYRQEAFCSQQLLHVFVR